MPNRLLAGAMRANAVFSLVTGVGMALGAPWLGPILGLPVSWPLAVVGLGLLPFAGFLLWRAGDPTSGLIATAGDFGWVLGSIALLALFPGWFSSVGIGAVIVVAVAVDTFAMLQLWGAVRARRTAFA